MKGIVAGALLAGAWVGPPPATAGLVSHWAAEGDAQDSAGTNPGTLVDGVAFGPGAVGQAFRFDGTSYVRAGTAGMPTGNQDRTLFLWFNLASNNAGEDFFAGYGTPGVAGQTYGLLAIDNTLVFSQWGLDLRGGRFGLGQWHSAAVTNVGNAVTLYLDGEAVAGGNLPMNTAAGTDFFIGRIPGSGDYRRSDGSIDEVRVYDLALSAAEIRALSAVVPEPATLALGGIGAGLLGLARLLRRRTPTPGPRG